MRRQEECARSRGDDVRLGELLQDDRRAAGARRRIRRDGDNPLTAEPVVILGYNFWQNRLSSDPDIIGKTLTLDGIPHVVVGIAPDQFSGHLGFQERQLFVPLERYPRLCGPTRSVRFDRGNEWVHIHGRLSPGVGIAQASAAVAAVTARLAKDYPATNQLKAGIVEPYDPLGYRNEFRIVEALGLTLTGTVLLVVCLNISGMMQVRSAMRERELSIRQAIGASRGRLVQISFVGSDRAGGSGGPSRLGRALQRSPVVGLVDRPPPSVRSPGGAETRSIHRRDLCRTMPGDQPGLRILAGDSFQSSRDHLCPEGRCRRRRGPGGTRSSLHRCAAGRDRGAVDRPERHRARSRTCHCDRQSRIRIRPVVRGAVDVQRCRRRESRASESEASATISNRRAVSRPSTVADGLPLDFGSRSARVSLQVDKNSAPRVVFVQVTRVGDGYLDTMGIPLLRRARLHH